MTKYYRKPTPELLTTSTGIKYTGYQFYFGDRQSVEDVEIPEPPSIDRVWYLDSNSQWIEYAIEIDLQTMLVNELITLDKAKEILIEKVNKLCYEKIINGYTSDALGENYIYQSKEIDQFNTFVNMYDSMSSNTPVLQRCVRLSNGVDEFVLHTPEQIQQVFKEGKNYILNLLQRCKTLKNMVESSTSETITTIDIESGW